MKKFFTLTIAMVLCLTGCSNSISSSSASMTQEQILQYKQISQSEAQEMMNREDGHIIVDVRRRDEYDEGHLPDAILIPNESIDKTRPSELRNLDQIILVYCRSGLRSKEASEKLAAMGYRNVYEFGGIITWPGETVR